MLLTPAAPPLPVTSRPNPGPFVPGWKNQPCGNENGPQSCLEGGKSVEPVCAEPGCERNAYFLPTFRRFPMERKSLFMLFQFLSCLTVVWYFRAILPRLSPDLTV